MALYKAWISDFRCFSEVFIEPDPAGVTVLHGANGSGKTSLLEAIGWLSTMRSIRGATRETVIKTDTPRSFLRAEVQAMGSVNMIEMEIDRVRQGRSRLNGQPVQRRSKLAEAFRVSVFSPADRALVEGGPSSRRDFLDEVLRERGPRVEALVDEVNHVVRQRTALLRQVSGRPDHSALSTLDVWDARLAAAGDGLALAREDLTEQLEPLVAAFYRHLAGDESHVRLEYSRSWQGPLLEALRQHRSEDLARQVTTTGPHRDELHLKLSSQLARTHASQGEQRCLAFALRLATHELRRKEVSEAPVLLLDDVFSELDPGRSSALLDLLPQGQVLLTTAVEPPSKVGADRVLEVANGSLKNSTTLP